MKQAPETPDENKENYVPLTIEELQAIMKTRRRIRELYDGHRTGKGRYTKPTMKKKERRKKRRKNKKLRKENRR